MAALVRFGKYTLIKKIASGGMGEVFLAKQRGPEGFEKTLVIKRILNHHTDNPEYIEMFFAEAKLAARMSHSNIVQIYEMGQINQSYYIAMEFVNGRSMRDIIDRAKTLNKRIPADFVINLMARLVAGLGYAHSMTDGEGKPMHLIHRDINPHNVLVSYDGDPKIIDFGIAKSTMSRNDTEEGTIKGKFVYMSPEQSAAEPMDKRSDIFSAGIVFYEMLTGVNPFQKPNIVLSLDAIQRLDPDPVSKLNPDLIVYQAQIEPIIKKILHKKPAERYQDCRELQRDLNQLLSVVQHSDKSFSDLMEEMFKEDIDHMKKILSVDVNSGEESSASEFSRTEITPGSTKPNTSVLKTSSKRRIKEKKRKQTLVVMLALTLLIFSSGVLLLLLFKDRLFQYNPNNGGPIVLDLSAEERKKQEQLRIEKEQQIQREQEERRKKEEAERIKKEQDAQNNQLSNSKGVNSESKNTQETGKITNNTSSNSNKDLTGKKDPVSGLHNTKNGTHNTEDLQKQQALALQKQREEEEHRKKEEAERIKKEQDAQKSVGYFLINSNPPATIIANHTPVGRGQTRFDVNNRFGVIQVGDAGSPFKITIQYRLNAQQGIEYVVESQPPALFKKSGVSLGQTPQSLSLGQASTPQTFELTGTSSALGQMIVKLRFMPAI